MRVEYVNPFIDSAIEILKMSVSEDVKRGEISLSSNITPMLGVVVLIGLVGQVTGRVILDMEESTALKIASKMNSENLVDFDKLTCGTLTELANMIVGNAVTKLHELGFQFDLTPPAILFGQNIKMSDENLEALIVPMQIPEGKIEINVALKEV